MKKPALGIVLTVMLFVFCDHVASQIVPSISIGYSNYCFHNNSNDNIENVFSFKFKPIVAFKTSIERYMERRRYTFMTGLTLIYNGAFDEFFGTWRNMYGGVVLGGAYRVFKSFRIGVKTTPCLRIFSSPGVGGQGGGLSDKRKQHYFIDILPFASYAVSKRSMVQIEYSYGLNNAIKTGRGIDYSINSLFLSWNYVL